MQSSETKLPVYAPTFENEVFVPIGQRIQAYIWTQPDKVALHDGERGIRWAELVHQVNAIANRLRQAGLQVGDKVAGLSENSANYVALYLGVVAAGGCMVPLSGMASGDTLELMINDSGASFLFVSNRNRALTDGFRSRLPTIPASRQIGLDFEDAVWQGFEHWIGDASQDFVPVPLTLDDAFNIIYSSGTTGTPKGILHDHRFRSRQIKRITSYGLDGSEINLVSTPLYSNTTLVSVLPSLFNGATLVLMPKFDAREFLALSQQHRVTVAMLVPVQYERILALPEFDQYDLSSYQLKLSTSAPLHSQVVAEAMRRWPGNLREMYGLTEGGISAGLDCGAYPDKWDSVGQPTEGAEIRIIDEDGHELPQGEIGEVVGRAGAMMRGYHNRPEQTEEILWTSPDGKVFYRSGDMGRFDTDGFLYLLDRRKDMIISGGFNIYAVDLEKVLLAHPAVADATVIGIPSAQWGETPLGLVVRRDDSVAETDLLAWANEQLGKAQRLSGVEFRDELPRSTIGKVLKRELRAPYWEGQK